MTTEVLEVPPALKMGPVSERFHRKVWEATRWVPYDKQREIILNRARFKLNAAGRRAGKSQVGGNMLLPEAFRALGQLDELEETGHRREFWIVGPEYTDAEKEFRVFYNGMKRLGFEPQYDHPGTYDNSESGQMRVSCFDQRFIVHAKSAKYPATLVGEGLSGVVFSEAAKLKPSVWTKYLRPTLADFLGWAYFGSTPEGKNWFYDLWMAGQDSKRPEWQSWRNPSWVNPYVYPGGADPTILEMALEGRNKGRLDMLIRTFKMITSELGVAPAGVHPEIWSMFLDMSPELFKQEIACDFTEFVGRVFKNFDDEIHVVDDGEHAHWDTYYCADYGFTNPFVWLKIQINPHKTRVHVCGEYYERGRTTEEACAEIRSRGLATPALGFYPDPSEPDRTREIQQRLGIRALSPGSLEIQDRLEWIRRFLKNTPPHIPTTHPESFPGFTVTRNCPNTIREFNDYRYKETHEQASARGRSAPENPLKKDDHTPEAIGRFMSGHLGKPLGGPTRQSTATIGRRRRA